MIARDYANRESLSNVILYDNPVPSLVRGRCNDYPVAGSTLEDELPMEVLPILDIRMKI